MEERINVFFGSSYINPSITHVMPQGEIVEYLDDGEGNKIIPFYSSDVESWLARCDMSFRLYNIRPENLEWLTEEWEQLAKETCNGSLADEDVQEKLKMFTFKALS